MLVFDRLPVLIKLNLLASELLQQFQSALPVPLLRGAVVLGVKVDKQLLPLKEGPLGGVL